jgi:hypothetical protein
MFPIWPTPPLPGKLPELCKNGTQTFVKYKQREFEHQVYQKLWSKENTKRGRITFLRKDVTEEKYLR